MCPSGLQTGQDTDPRNLTPSIPALAIVGDEDSRHKQSLPCQLYYVIFYLQLDVGSVEKALLRHNLWTKWPLLFLGMAGLKVAKFYLGTGAFSCPVTLVTSPKPPSSLFHLATSNEETSSINALRSGHCHREDTAHLLLSKVPMEHYVSYFYHFV